MAIPLKGRPVTSGGGSAPAPSGGGGIIDLLRVNWEGGSNAQYDISQMSPNGDGTYSYGGYTFDSSGKPLSGGVPGDGPGQWVEGYPGARGGGAGGAGGGAGGDPSLFGNPYYQQVLAAVNAAAAADAAGRRSGIQQALISFGEAPGGFTDKYGDVDALTRELAEKNTSSGISTKARLLQARADAIKQFSRANAARGLRRSGQKGWGLRRRQLEHDQGYSDALGKLLGYTGSLYSTFAQNEYSRALQLASAAQYASQFADGGGGGGGGGGYVNPYLVQNPMRYVDGTGTAVSSVIDQPRRSNPTQTYTSVRQNPPPSLSKFLAS